MNHSQAHKGSVYLYDSNPLNFNRYYLRKIQDNFAVCVVTPGKDSVFVFPTNFLSALDAALYTYNVEFNNEPYSLL